MPSEKHMYQSISHTNNKKDPFSSNTMSDELFSNSLMNSQKPHSNTAVYNKRKQQVDSIQQMLNATDSIRQNYNMKSGVQTKTV